MIVSSGSFVRPSTLHVSSGGSWVRGQRAWVYSNASWYVWFSGITAVPTAISATDLASSLGAPGARVSITHSSSTFSTQLLRDGSLLTTLAPDTVRHDDYGGGLTAGDVVTYSARYFDGAAYGSLVTADPVTLT